MTKIHLVIVIDTGREDGIEILAAHRTRTNALNRTADFNQNEPGYLKYAVRVPVELED